MIPDGSGGLVKDERGAVVLSKLESATLRELADATNGAYQDASNWIDLAALVSSTVESGKQGDFLEKNTIRLVERFPVAARLGALVFACEFLLRVSRAPPTTGSETFNGLQIIPTRRFGSAASSLILLSLLIGSLAGLPVARCRRRRQLLLHPPPLARIVGRLSTTAQPTARDWAELGRETVTWGSKLQSSQQPVTRRADTRCARPPSNLGSKLDPKDSRLAQTARGT